MNELSHYLDAICKSSCLNPIKPGEFIHDVEIVVPIYNGYSAVKKCINSLLQHTSPTQAITLLNDASTDTNLSQYLLTISQKHPNIKLITRLHNEGYLRNVNLHLNNSTHDVLLLNSDTEVTLGWLDEMLKVAVDPVVGIVCPLSDHATILSITEVDNGKIKSLKKLSGYWFPIPTAVGFCMLIKAGLWQKLNGFDPYYDPGYGEECDFSLLLRQQGLQVACAPAAFVYHQGSQSFQDQGESLQVKHQHLLDLRWPQYQPEIRQFNKLNPVQWVKQWLINQHTDSPRVLHVVHGIENKGGVELFTKKLLKSFDRTFHHTVLVNTAGKNKFRPISAEWPIEVIKLNMDAFDPDHVIFDLPADLYHKKLDLYFKYLLEWGGFKYVHIHSTVGIGTSIWPQICHRLDIPYGLFFHDHSGLCEIFSLSTTIRQEEIYCGKTQAKPKDKTCQRCLGGKTKKARLKTSSYLSVREKIWQDNLLQAQHLQFCSQYLFDMYQPVYKNISSKSLVIEPCFHPDQITPTRSMKKAEINVAFLGQFGVLKGAQLFIDLYHQINDSRYNWQIIGGVDPIYQSQLDRTAISTTGSYESAELIELLSGVDLIVFTTQIPETYGITLTEAMLHGIVVVAPDLGAYADRVKAEHCGVLYQPNSLKSLVTAVEKIVAQQKDDDNRIKQIEYIGTSVQTPAKINALYQSAIVTKKSRSLNANDVNTLMDLPPINAYEVMQKWLDAPMTLEAAADWKEVPNGTVVLIYGELESYIEQTKASLEQHLNSPSIYLCSEAQIQSNVLKSRVVLLIQAGSLINDNMGNWLEDFKQKNVMASLADFALHNQQHQIYAPQFMGSFSWQNVFASQANIGCMLLNPKIFDEPYSNNEWRCVEGFKPLLRYLHRHHKDHVSYFPYFSYSMADHQFAANWKRQSKHVFLSPQKSIKKISIWVETQAAGMALMHLKQKYQQQQWQQDLSVKLNFFKRNDKSTTVKLLNRINEEDEESALFIISDNVQINNKYSLQLMITALNESEVDALSIPAARSHNKHNLIAKKAGAANYFQAIGVVKDLRFSVPHSVFEYEWLDDDFWLFTAKAWQAAVSVYQQDFGSYTALKVSSKLQQHGYKIGLINLVGISKRGLPSACIWSNPSNLAGHRPEFDLKAQRQQLIAERCHIPNKSHHSSALSARQGHQLELNITSFKTPKNLPRVLAYAEDDWASGFYRVKSPLSALAADNKISVHFLANKGQLVTPTPYEIHRMKADVLLLHGFYADHQLAALNQYKKQLNIRIIISIDDYLTEIPNYNSLADKIPKDIKTRIKLACELADTLIVSTAELAKLMKPFHNHTVVIPNRLSKHIWQKNCDSQQNNKQNNDRLRVGWAGAGQHQADLAFLNQVVNNTAPYCDWVFFGDQPQKIKADNFEFHKPVDLLDYPQKLNKLGLDLAVAPLVDNAFNRAKSPLKLIEYGVLGLPVLASDLVCYQNSPAILLGNDVVEWSEKINTLNENRMLLQQNGQTMQQWVHNHFWLEEHHDEWLKVLGLN